MEREYKESIYFEEVTVELVVLTSGGALDVVPPIAGEELLTKDSAVGAEERVLSAANVANVKHLSKKKSWEWSSRQFTEHLHENLLKYKREWVKIEKRNQQSSQ